MFAVRGSSPAPFHRASGRSDERWVMDASLRVQTRIKPVADAFAMHEWRCPHRRKTLWPALRIAGVHPHVQWHSRARVSAEDVVREELKHGPVSSSPPHHRRVDPAVEERRRVIVALLRRHPKGLTAREIGETTGISRNLTASALSGLFTRGILHKHGHRYVLAAQDKALNRSSEG